MHGFAGYPASAPIPALIEVLKGIPPANNEPIVVDLLPGLHARYSGGGTTIAQQVVADVLRRPLPDVMRELILDPLQMSRSTYEQPLPRQLLCEAAVAHGWDGAPLSGGWYAYPEMAAAGLWTTAADLGRLAIELLRILRGDQSVLDLNREEIYEMLRPQMPGQKDNFYGIGWLCSGMGTGFEFGHGGRNEGYVSSMRLVPAGGKAGVILLNSNRAFPLREEVIAAIGREYNWPSRPNPTTTAAISADIKYNGIYRDTEGFEFRVIQTEQGLRLCFGMQTSVPLVPITPFEFASTVLNLNVSFATEIRSGVTAMTVIQDGKVIVATKQINPPTSARSLAPN